MSNSLCKSQLFDTLGHLEFEREGNAIEVIYIGILPRSDKGLVYMVGQLLLNSGLFIIFLIY